MDLFKKYAVDPKLEEEGKLHDFGGGIKMLVARSGNFKYNRMLKQRYDAHKHTLDLKGSKEEVAAANKLFNEIMAEVMAHSVLLGWTGPVEFNGEPLPYSVANAQKLLELKEFQKEIAALADDFKNFRAFTEEEDVKNSSTTSSGSSDGVAQLTISSS